MTFPVEINVFNLHLHPHPVMEAIGYTGGAQLYFFLRRRQRRRAISLDPVVPIEPNLWLLVGCVFGALVGAKLLAWAESWDEYRTAIAGGDWHALIGGKTIVGGLLGGWVGVEVAKRRVGVTSSTGDLFVFPLIVGIAVGRVGCFLTGLADHTHGVATTLPWAVDFGDGVTRHPTQLYEIAWLALLGVALWRFSRRLPSADLESPGAPPRVRGLTDTLAQGKPGSLFRLFLIGYLGFRFAVEFIKPSDKPLLGLSAIQVACAAGVAVCVLQLRRRGATAR